jgi:hypothetical protein
MALYGRRALPRFAFPRRPNCGWQSIQQINAGRIIINHRSALTFMAFFVVVVVEEQQQHQ